MLKKLSVLVLFAILLATAVSAMAQEIVDVDGTPVTIETSWASWGILFPNEDTVQVHNHQAPQDAILTLLEDCLNFLSWVFDPQVTQVNETTDQVVYDTHHGEPAGSTPVISGGNGQQSALVDFGEGGWVSFSWYQQCEGCEPPVEPEICVETTPGEWSTWSDWVEEDGVKTRTRTRELLDANTGESCGMQTQSEEEVIETSTDTVCITTTAARIERLYSAEGALIPEGSIWWQVWDHEKSQLNLTIDGHWNDSLLSVVLTDGEHLQLQMQDGYFDLETGQSNCYKVFPPVILEQGLGEQSSPWTQPIVGEIEIPSLGLEREVREALVVENSINQPTGMVVQYGDDILVHQAGFPAIGSMQVGDEIVINDNTYVIASKQVMDKITAAAYVLDHLTVVTCTEDWQDNVVFTLRRVPISSRHYAD